MTAKKRGSLRVLVRMMIFSLCLAIIGSWGMLLARLDLGSIQSIIDRRQISLFYLDLIGLALTLTGLFMAIYYRIRLEPRLKRLEELGEDRW